MDLNFKDFAATCIRRVIQPEHLTCKAFEFFNSYTPAVHDSFAAIEVVCISNLGKHPLVPRHIPRGDVLIHTGNLTETGSRDEIQAQIDWLDDLRDTLFFEKVFVIAGGQDKYLQNQYDNIHHRPLDWRKVSYLNDKEMTFTIDKHLLNGATVQRRFTIFGSPRYPVPRCGSKGFPYFEDDEVTNPPPENYFDAGPDSRSKGCRHLLKKIREAKPALHVFDNEHCPSDKRILRWDKGQQAYEEARKQTSVASVPASLGKELWNLCLVCFYGIIDMIWFSFLFLGSKPFSISTSLLALILYTVYILLYVQDLQISIYGLERWIWFLGALDIKVKVALMKKGSMLFSTSVRLRIFKWIELKARLEPTRRDTILVNARVRYDSRGNLLQRPQVVRI